MDDFMKIYFLPQKRTLRQFFIAIFFIGNVIFLQTAYSTKQPLPVQQPTTNNIYTSIVMCPSCGFFFENLNEMHCHFFYQHTDQQTTCLYCGDMSISPEWLNEHIKIHTTQIQFVQTESVDPNPLIMPQNNASIEENNKTNIIFAPTIIIYENQKQNQPRNYLCSTCNKSFVHKCDLTIHQRSHTGQRPYQCPLCLKKFTTSSNLWRHFKSKSHIFKTPQKCTHCPLEYSNAKALCLHLQNVHGYKLNLLQK